MSRPRPRTQGQGQQHCTIHYGLHWAVFYVPTNIV